MIEKMNHYSLTNPASVYDEEALTALELAGRTAAKMNQTVEAFNTLEETTENHLEAQDKDIQNQKEVVIPNSIKEEVQNQIDNGTFDKQISDYAGELEDRLNNLLGSVPEGGTSMDAEVIDSRLGLDGTQYDNMGEAIRSGFANVHQKVCLYNGFINWNPTDYSLGFNFNTSDTLTGIGVTIQTNYPTNKDKSVMNLTIPVPDTFVLSNSLHYIVLNYLDKTITANLGNTYVRKQGDIILCATFGSQIWVLGLAEHCLYVNDYPLFANVNQNLRGEICTFHDVVVNQNENTITIPETFLIGRYGSEKELYKFAYTVMGTIPEQTLTIAPNSATQNVCFNRKTMEMSVVNRNYYFTKDENCLFTFFNNKVIPVELNRECVKYVETKSDDAISKDSYKSLDSVFGRISCSERPLKIVLGGDSITHGVGGTNFAQNGDLILDTGDKQWYRNPNGYCWGNLFKDYIESNYNATVVNNACSGMISWHWWTYRQTLIPDDTDILILMIGTNDRIPSSTGNTRETRLKVYYDYLTDIVSYCHNKGIHVILLSPIPATEANDNKSDYVCKSADMNGVVKRVASEFNMEYVNMYNNLFFYMRVKGLNYSDYLPDGLHPNNDGHRVIFYELLRSLGLAPSHEEV